MLAGQTSHEAEGDGDFAEGAVEAEEHGVSAGGLVDLDVFAS